MDFWEAFVYVLSNSKLVESRNRKTEDTEEFLEPRFDSRASFYKKAKVVKRDNGDEELYSYDTHVGGVKDGKPYSKGKWSQTTTRHQKEYFQQKGYDPKDVEVVESKKVERKGEVPDTSYQLAEYIKDNASSNILGKEDFERLLDDGKSTLNIKDNDADLDADLDAEVRGILSYYGWDTDYESGDIFKAEESKKVTEGLEDNISKAYDYLEDINMGAADLLMKVADYFGQDQANEFATELVSNMHEGKNYKKGGE